MTMLLRFLGLLMILGLIKNSQAGFARKQEILKSIVNTCSACNYAKALIDNEPPLDDITQILKDQCKIYGKRGRPKEFCENMDEHVKNGYQLAKLYSQQGCEKFCGANEKILSTDMLCNAKKYVTDHLDFYMDKYLPKIAKYICKGKEKCAQEMVSDKELIEGFIQRVVLRGARMIDNENSCGIDTSKIQMAKKVLDQTDNNTLGTKLLCDLCARFADFLNDTIFNENSPAAGPFWIAMAHALIPICKILPKNIQDGFNGCSLDSIVALIQTILPVLQACIPSALCDLLIPQCPKNDLSTCKNLIPTKFPTFFPMVN